MWTTMIHELDMGSKTVPVTYDIYNRAGGLAPVGISTTNCCVLVNGPLILQLHMVAFDSIRTAMHSRSARKLRRRHGTCGVTEPCLNPDCSPGVSPPSPFPPSYRSASDPVQTW